MDSSSNEETLEKSRSSKWRDKRNKEKVKDDRRKEAHRQAVARSSQSEDQRRV